MHTLRFEGFIAPIEGDVILAIQESGGLLQLSARKDAHLVAFLLRYLGLFGVLLASPVVALHCLGCMR